MYKLIAIVLIAIVAGCASVPANYGKPIAGSKVGVVLLIDETLSHQHVGTTIFQKSSSDGASTENFHKMFESEISRILIRGEHLPISIEPSSMLINSREALLSYASNNIHFKQENKLEL